MSSELKKTDLSRRFLLAGLLATAATPVLGGAPERSRLPQHRPTKVLLAGAEDVEKVITHANLSGTTAFVVADATTGEILETRKQHLALPPASVTKSITTLYGLDSLSDEFRFKTRVIADGVLKNGRLEGDLYLMGGGDPMLDSDALGALVRQLKEAGLREVGGKTYVHSEALPYQKSIDPEQPDYLGYNPSLSGLNLNYNRVFFEWQKKSWGYSVTMDARARKYRPRVTVSSMEVVERSRPIFTLNTKPQEDEWTVAKYALGQKGGRWLPVRRPEFYAAEVFQSIGRSFGIEMPDFQASDTVAGTVLASLQSAPLPDVLRAMLKYSNNLIAETVGTSASRARGEDPLTIPASGQLMTDWMRDYCDARHSHFVDHSGLGDDSRTTARDVIKLLLQDGWDGQLRSLMKNVSFADHKGRASVNKKVKVKAKTGTLNFVSGLAGFVEVEKGRNLVFAIFSADMDKRAKIKRSERERPRGSSAWNSRAKTLQRRLLSRWVDVFEV